MLILLFEFILPEGLKVVLIKTKQKLLLHWRIFLVLGWHTFDAFMRIHEDYVKKDAGVMGHKGGCASSSNENPSLWTDVNRLYFGSKVPETEVVITSDNNKILHNSTSRQAKIRSEKFLTERPSWIHSTNRNMIHKGLKRFFWEPQNTWKVN